MPDGSTISALSAPAVPQQKRFRARWVSPLLRRILLVNALPLALLVAALLYLDQYQNGLLEAEVSALREQARIYSGALGESAVRTTEPDNPKLAPDIARPLLRRLTEPTPGAQAKLYAPDGTAIADSRVREGPSGAVSTEPLPPAVERGPIVGAIGWVYDKVLDAVAARDADTSGGGHDAGGRRVGVAAGREGGATPQQFRPKPRNAAVHPANQG